MSDSRRTPLYDEHRKAGARFTAFAGWEMPLQYRSLLAEHEAVRTRAGVFDVSHMGEIEVRGPGALELCQWITTNDAAALEVGRAQYTLWCDQSGGTIDDTILYRMEEERFLFCVNAGNAETCASWIASEAEGRSAVEVRDLSSETSLLAVQGPKAAETLERAGGGSLAQLTRFGCARADVGGIPVFAARTGYTGEDGFELFVANDGAAPLWRNLLERAGGDLGVEPVGLGARDTLRLEAGLPLYGHELGRTITPLEAGLGWAVKLAKGDFIGARPLAEMRARGVPRRLVGLRLTEPGIARADYPVLSGDRRVGIVTSGTKSPTLGDSIALALIEREWVDASLSVEIRGRRAAAERTALPFYQGSAKQRSDGRSG